MSDKHYIGLDTISFEDNGKQKPVSRVTLFIDDENCYTAGDDTGREITAECPSATQEMVDNLLTALKGAEHQTFAANGAGLDPAAELGDGVTIGGIYTALTEITDKGGFPDIAAPGKAESDDEYPYESPMQREFNRKIAQTRSYIKQSNEEIELLIENEINGLSSSFSVNLDAITARIDGLDEDFIEVKATVDGLTVTDESGTTRIKGSSIETDTLYVKAANVTGTITASAISVKDAYGNNLLNAGGNAVKIATWNVDNNSFYSGDTFDASDVYLCTGSVGATSIAGSPYLENWVFKAGSHFGVQKDGTAYMSNAIVQGTVTANYGTIGPWKVKDVALYDGSALIYSGKALAAAETGDGSAIYLTPEYLFTQSTTGSDTVSVYARWSRIAALAQ